MRQLLGALAVFAASCSPVVYEQQPAHDIREAPASPIEEPVEAPDETFVPHACESWDDLSELCGTLQVAEIRGEATDGDIVVLPVKMTESRDAALPVVVLGDPGLTLTETLANHRQVITVGARGSATASPSTSCFWIASEETREHYERCRDGFQRAGIDLAAYDASSSALDVISLLDAMDIARVDIVAVRLTAAVAAHLQALASDRVERVVAVEPITADVRTLAPLSDRIDALAALCDSQRACAEQVGDLTMRFAVTLQQLHSEPLTVAATDFAPEITFDGDRLATLADRLLSLEPGAATIGRLLDAVEDRDLTYIGDVVEVMTSFNGDLHELAIACALPLTSAPDDSIWIQIDEQHHQDWNEVCEPWGFEIDTAPELEATRVGSTYFLPTTTNVDGLGALSAECLDHQVLIALQLTTSELDPCATRRMSIITVVSDEVVGFEEVIDWGVPVTFSGTHLQGWHRTNWGSIDRASDLLDSASISFDVWELPADEVAAELMYSWDTEPLTVGEDIGAWRTASASSTWNDVRLTFGMQELAPDLTAVGIMALPLAEYADFAAEIDRFFGELEVATS